MEQSYTSTNVRYYDFTTKADDRPASGQVSDSENYRMNALSVAGQEEISM